MALHDHFHPPLKHRRHWHSFHNSWATSVSAQLNQRLPEGYFAETNVRFEIEIDDATSAESVIPSNPERCAGDRWRPPDAVQSIPLPIVTDSVEVLVYNTSGGPTLAGAIELVSPANKDRKAHRDAFVAKCVAYLQQGIGLVVVDIVTERKADLHDLLMAWFDAPETAPGDRDLYAAAYRPVVHDEEPSLDIWRKDLAVGGPLPTMPLWLPGSICLPVELDEAYERTCRELRIVADAS